MTSSWLASLPFIVIRDLKQEWIMLVTIRGGEFIQLVWTRLIKADSQARLPLPNNSLKPIFPSTNSITYKYAESN